MSVLTNAEKIARLEIKVAKLLDFIERISTEDLRGELETALKMANLQED